MSEVLLEEDRVRVTATVVTVGAVKYPVHGITSVEVRVRPGASNGSGLLGVLAMLGAMCGVILLILMGMVLLGPRSAGDGGVLVVLGVAGIGLTLGGGAGLRASSRMPPPGKSDRKG